MSKNDIIDETMKFERKKELPKPGIEPGTVRFSVYRSPN